MFRCHVIITNIYIFRIDCVLLNVKGAVCLLYCVVERQGSGMFDIFMNVKEAACLIYSWSREQYVWYIHDQGSGMFVIFMIKRAVCLNVKGAACLLYSWTSRERHVWYIHERQGSGMFVMRTSLQTINKHMKSLKITKRQSEAVSRRKTDNAMAKTKLTKVRTTIYKTLHRKLKFEQHESH